MPIKTYTGSCHCGAVRFEADLDLSQGAARCNCSICRKARNWSAHVTPERFRLLSEPDAVADYHFGSDSVHWPFCKRCGVRPYNRGDLPQMGGAFYTVQLACLDGVPDEDLAASPIVYCNGRENDWRNPPSEAERRFL